MGTHRSLKAWQHAHKLAVLCSGAARSFPIEERFELASQLKRAAFGAALNIAEGSGRKGSRDYLRFLTMARASLDEVEAILELGRDAGYLSNSQYAELEGVRDEAARTLFGLIRAVKSRTAAQSVLQLCNSATLITFPPCAAPCASRKSTAPC